MQRRTPSRVLGYRSRKTRTRLSVCFNGLELEFELQLDQKLVRAVLQNK